MFLELYAKSISPSHFRESLDIFVSQRRYLENGFKYLYELPAINKKNIHPLTQQLHNA